MCEQHFFPFIMPLFSFLVLFMAALGYLVFANTLLTACFNQLGKQDDRGRSWDPTGPTTSGLDLGVVLQSLRGNRINYSGNIRGIFENASPNTNMPECNFQLVLYFYCMRL